MRHKGELMGTHINKNVEIIKIQSFFVIIMTVIAVILKSMQVLFFYDDNIGLIKNSFIPITLNAIVYVIILLVVAISYKLAVDMGTVSVKVSKVSHMATGYILYIVSALFLINASVSIFSNFELWNNTYEKTKSLFSFFPLAVEILCILSAISFCVMAKTQLNKNGRKNKSSSLITIIPSIWGIAVVILLLVDMAKIVSMQFDVEKTILSCVALLCLYDMLSVFSGVNEDKKYKYSVLIKASFTCVGIVMTLPYLVGFLFGTKDLFINTPYLAYLGLAVYSLVDLSRDIVSAIMFLLRKKSLEKG